MGRDSLHWASELTRLARERQVLASQCHGALEAAAQAGTAPSSMSFFGGSASAELLESARMKQRATSEVAVAECEERLARNLADERKARKELAQAARSEDEALYALERVNYMRRRPAIGQGLSFSEDDYRRALNAVPAWVFALFVAVVFALTLLRSSTSGSSTLDAVSQAATLAIGVLGLGIAFYGVRIQRRQVVVAQHPQDLGVDDPKNDGMALGVSRAAEAANDQGPPRQAPPVSPNAG